MSPPHNLTATMPATGAPGKRRTPPQDATRVVRVAYGVDWCIIGVLPRRSWAGEHNRM